MSHLDSPELMAYRLESRIARSESNNQLLITQAETRLNARIHELEMKLIRRGVFCWPETDTLFRWIFPLWLACMLIFLFVGARSAPIERKPDNVQPASQDRPAETPVPQGSSTQDKSE
jgi:hypothetical protein